ncbi:MAG: MFS transporter [Candidatus Thorarchaeota archaeon]
MGGGTHVLEIAAVMLVYPVAELTSVSFFGSYSDKIGRNPILITSLFITGFAALSFAFTPNVPILLIASVIFGLGAAWEGSTALSMIRDMSAKDNGANLMSYYNLSTLMGLISGYGMGAILLEFGFMPVLILGITG